ILQRIVPTIRAYGSSGNINDRILDAMALERGTGVDASNITQLQRLSRVMSQGQGATGLVQSVYKSMAGTGAFGDDDRDLARLNEMVETFIQFSQGQFMRTGMISSGSPYLNLRR